MARMMTVVEAAKELGCSKANIYRLIKKHKIKVETTGEMQELKFNRYVKTDKVDVDELKRLREGV